MPDVVATAFRRSLGEIVGDQHQCAVGVAGQLDSDGAIGRDRDDRAGVAGQARAAGAHREHAQMVGDQRGVAASVGRARQARPT